MISIPEGIAFLLLVLLAAALVPVTMAFIRLSKEKAFLEQWPLPSGDSAIQRTFDRVRAVVRVGGVVNAAELADMAVEESLPRGLTLSRYLGQSSVYLGLGGALLGLQQAVGNLGGFKMSTMQEFQAFVERITKVLTDFSGAFWAALAGIAVTVILNLVIQGLEKRIQSLSFQLEDEIRNRLLKEAGVEQKVDPAFEALRRVALELGDIIVGAKPALENTMAQMVETSKGLNELIASAVLGLTTVRQEFILASDGLSTSLKDGAASIEAAADRVSQNLSTASREAGRTIAESADQGARAIKSEVEAANLGHEKLIESTERLESTFTSVQTHLDRLESTLSTSRQLQEVMKLTQEELRNSAEAHKAFAQGVRSDLFDANHPLLNQLKDQSEEMQKLFGELSQTLKGHRDFVTQLGLSVAQLPDTITQEKVGHLVETAFVPVRTKLEESSKEVLSLRQDLHNLRSDLSAISSLGGKQQESLLDRLAALDRKLDDAGIETDLHELTRQVQILRSETSDIKLRVNAPAIGRLFGRK